jgi:hypothetical protein
MFGTVRETMLAQDPVIFEETHCVLSMKNELRSITLWYCRVMFRGVGHNSLQIIWE